MTKPKTISSWFLMSVQRLLDAARITLPKTMADRGVRVSTRKKPVDERKPRRNKRLAPGSSAA